MSKIIVISAFIFIFNSLCNAFEFTPLSASATPDSKPENKPFVLPNSYDQEIVSDENTQNIYPDSDWFDMLTLNESGPNAGRFLYRTHEVRPTFMSLNYKGAFVSVIDRQTGTTSVLIQREDWEAIDGILWTPWLTLLVGEETKSSSLPDPALPKAKRGHIYEIFLDRKDLTKVQSIVLREQLGSLAHEGIEYDTEGNIYLVDEDAEGSIYKFMPEIFGDLSKGQLYALKIINNNGDNTGDAQWIALDMSLAVIDAHSAAEKAGASSWCRPEDLERIGNTLYAALTCHKSNIIGQRLENRVISISLDRYPVVRNFVQENVNVAKENKHKTTGFSKPDNLAEGPDKTLWIVEDNSPSDIWVAYPDQNNDGYADSVKLFASLSDEEAEASGIYFADDYKNLYVNVQHSGTGNDKTMRIFRK